MLRFTSRTMNHKLMVVDRTILISVEAMGYLVFALLQVRIVYVEDRRAPGKSSIRSSKDKLFNSRLTLHKRGIYYAEPLYRSGL